MKVAWLAGRRVAVLSVALGWVACSAPGEGGGVFGGETLTEVEPADTAPDTSVPDRRIMLAGCCLPSDATR